MTYGPVTIPIIGGIPPFTFEIINGELPPNLTLDENTGEISGDLQEGIRPGAWPFTVEVTDSNVPASVAQKTYVINLIDKIKIAESSTLKASIYTRFEHQIKTIGGFPPFTFSASGLPTWLFMTEQGLLYGTPPKIGTYNFSVTVSDGLCGGTTLPLALLVENFPEIIPVESPCIEPNKLFYLQLVAKNGLPPYSWTTPDLNFQLPEYLELDQLTGIISGIVYNEQEKVSRIMVTDGAAKSSTLDIKFRINKVCGRAKYLHSPLSDPIVVKNDYHQINLYKILPDIY